MINHVTAQSFTVRRPYFDAIVAGTKTREVRALTEFWKTNTARIIESIARFGWAEAVFLCGRDVHRRQIVGVGWCEDAKEALGREPSEQGRKDLGFGPVVYYDLSRVIGEVPA